MVMMTRSRRRACESCSSSERSHQNVIPPWCSSAKIYEKKRLPSWENKSACDMRENIWEYLHRDDERPPNIKRTKRHKRSRYRCAKITKLLVFSLVCLVVLGLIWNCSNERKVDLMARLMPYTKLISLTIGHDSSAVSEECCSRMEYLSEALQKAEQALRNIQRMKRSILLASNSFVEKSDLKQINQAYITDVIVTRGKDTEEWGGKVALWGIVPLWRAAPPPNTVLNLRRPIPADCWPFSGSAGELNIELPQREVLACISIEHVRPDTAQSSPKNFALYGILENGTWIKTLEAEYKYQGPAKQYFPLNLMENIALKRLVFQVLSNNGNDKYTCLYRMHIYRKYVNKERFP